MTQEDFVIEIDKGSRFFQFKVEEVVKVKDLRRGPYAVIREIEGNALFGEEGELKILKIDDITYLDEINFRELNSSERIEKDKKSVEKDASFLTLIKNIFRFKGSVWQKSKNGN